ncbi:MAG: hypothetical protein ACJAT2_001012 [Bacteriovoracaceae bacterium]
MIKILILSILFLSSCSSFFDWDKVVIQGIKKEKTANSKKTPKAFDLRSKFIGRYKFAGANIERATSSLVPMKACPKDSLFIEKNDFEGLSLAFRDKSSEYFYDNIYFINSRPPLNWIAEEDLETLYSGNSIKQSRKRIQYRGKDKVYLEYLTTIERVDDLLFYSSKVTVFKPSRVFSNELIPDYLGELHCAYGFDSLTDEQKKAQVRDMGY